MQRLLTDWWHWIIFLTLLFFATSYLLAPGVYNFTDSGYFPINSEIAKEVFVSKLGLFSNTDGFYYGFENSQRAFSSLFITFLIFSLVSIFGATIGQIMAYVLYYVLVFYFGLKLIRLLFPEVSEAAVRVGALFLAFNPFSLLVITMFSIGFAYALFIVFSYGLLKYLIHGHVRYLLLMLVSSIHVIYYPRFFPLFLFLLLCFLWIFRQSHKGEVLNIKRISLSLITLVLFLSPFVLGNIVSLTHQSNLISNYQGGFQRYEVENYNFKSSFLHSLSYPGAFTPSALSSFYNPKGRAGIDRWGEGSPPGSFYQILQILFTGGLVGATLICIGTKKFYKERGRVLFFAFLAVLLIGINTAAHFASFDFFTSLHNTIFIFLYNDYGFVQLAQVFLLSFILIYLIETLRSSAKSRPAANWLVVLVILFCFISALPYILHKDFYGLQKISDVPEEYNNALLDKSGELGREATVFVPYYWLNLDWTPHFINLNFLNDSRYGSLIVPNFRLASEEFVDLYNETYRHLGEPSINNLRLFNIKSFFLFKNVEDSDAAIDAYGVSGKAQTVPVYEQQLSNQENLSLIRQNKDMLHYRFSDADLYDFLLYSPRSVVESKVENLFTSSINYTETSVLLDTSKTATIPSQVSGADVVYKWGINNPNKYLVRVANTSTSKNILLQLNQMRSEGWTVYPISKAEYDAVPCTSRDFVTPLTHNSNCFYDSLSMDYRDFGFLFREPVIFTRYDGNHFGNLFEIRTEELSKEGGYTYLAIYFRAQLYYQLTLLLSFLVLLGLIFIWILKEISLHFRKQ